MRKDEKRTAETVYSGKRGVAQFGSAHGFGAPENRNGARFSGRGAAERKRERCPTGNARAKPTAATRDQEVVERPKQIEAVNNEV